MCGSHTWTESMRTTPLFLSHLATSNKDHLHLDIDFKTTQLVGTRHLDNFSCVSKGKDHRLLNFWSTMKREFIRALMAIPSLILVQCLRSQMDDSSREGNLSIFVCWTFAFLRLRLLYSRFASSIDTVWISRNIQTSFCIDRWIHWSILIDMILTVCEHGLL